MSSKDDVQSRDEVKAAREAKKLAKQKAKNKADKGGDEINKDIVKVAKSSNEVNIAADKQSKEKVAPKPKAQTKVEKEIVVPQGKPLISKDEVDRAITHTVEGATDKSKDQIKIDRAANKAAKQAKKKGESVKIPPPAQTEGEKNFTANDIVNTLTDIVKVAKDVQEVTAKVNAIKLEEKKQEDAGKSKAELKAERRAKQEAQRAAKQAALEQKEAAQPKAKETAVVAVKDKKSPVKQKVVDKTKSKSLTAQRVHWFPHLTTEQDKDSLQNIAINSNIHPAIIKLGVQLSSRVVQGSNARCIALLDALKKMVRDYSLPARTEFARGLEAQLAAALHYLWALRRPAASQTNAVKFLRHRLAQLPNNVDEFDAKKTLQEEIDSYIREQIDMAGEAISLTIRTKISPGDNIMTYGCSSLIERALREAWRGGARFRAVLVGTRLQPAARAMLRRLAAAGLPCTYIDITAIHFVIRRMNLVILGASALLAQGAALGAAGTALVAQAARAVNVPVLVAAETHKFCDRLLTDPFVGNDLGDPDDLIDKDDENSPLKDWRSNPNLTPLNVMYDITPPSLITAVVTELAILPCTSAPVVLRFKLSEYGM